MISKGRPCALIVTLLLVVATAAPTLAQTTAI
jgi:hypothetical protein